MFLLFSKQFPLELLGSWIKHECGLSKSYLELGWGKKIGYNDTDFLVIMPRRICTENQDEAKLTGAVICLSELMLWAKIAYRCISIECWLWK